MEESAVFDAVVVGAGWAGLGVSRALSDAGLQHVVLERHRIGETWRTQRWDSFHFNLPNIYSVMPGDAYQGFDPEGYMTHLDFVEMLEDYAKRHRLPVRPGVNVNQLTASERLFSVETGDGTWRCRHVVVASGSLNRPRRPSAAALITGPLQMDASDYRREKLLPAGAVLVVGSAQSGCQIAEDLVLAGRKTFLATSHIGRLPRHYRGHDIVIWMVRTGLFDTPRKDFVDAFGRVSSRPTLGARHTISLQSLSAQGVVLLGRFEGVRDGALMFADDVTENIRLGDQISNQFKRAIDDFIQRAGIDAPAATEDPAETVTAQLPAKPILELYIRVDDIAAIVWCTGFEGDFSWVKIPGALDDRGQPVHIDSISPIDGLYYAGLDFASTRRSGTVMAIEGEARTIVDHISMRL